MTDEKLRAVVWNIIIGFMFGTLMGTIKGDALIGLLSGILIIIGIQLIIRIGEYLIDNIEKRL